MKIAIVNCSAPYYNLGAQKIKNWLEDQGYTPTVYQGDPGMFVYGYDAVYLSVIFSWHALISRDIALRIKDSVDVYCGGPGMFALSKWWKRETGLDCLTGLDPRFERQRGQYKMTFASRGCPVNCWFCVVPKIEGVDFTLDWAFQPSPILCDNNLSALPVEFQSHIIKRYQETDTKLLDANSGFEPKTFGEDTYQRWKPILRGPWRFAFDEMREYDDVKRVMEILKDESSRRKRVYVLIGNEPIAACLERVQKVIEWGGEPHCQPILPLNALSREQFKILHDWSPQQLKDFARWSNKWLWRKMALWEYKPRKNQPLPFKNLVSHAD